MTSRTTANNVRGAEGDWWGPILRDLSDPRFSDELLALRTGRRIRGHALLITMEFKSAELVVFSLSDTSYTPSMITR